MKSPIRFVFKKDSAIGSKIQDRHGAFRSDKRKKDSPGDSAYYYLVFYLRTPTLFSTG
jgi:hypothetical protein